VPLDSARYRLALAPQFPLHSLPDENILAVCSLLRPSVFDAASLEKEKELIAELRTQLFRYAPIGPVSLPIPIPDIDLIIADEAASTVLFCELKWIRKPVRSGQIPHRDQEVAKGIRQLGQIREFLAKHPDHLQRHGKLPRRFDEYENIHFLLVARDHWPWIEPAGNIAIVEYGGFIKVLQRAKNLKDAVEGLLDYSWLPEEGRDFVVRFDRFAVNGVAVEAEVFYPA
jgi:hypothetical protein